MLTLNLCNCDTPVVHAKDIMPYKSNIDIAAELFKLFGDPTRVGILCALCRHDLCVCELASVLSMTSSAVSHQLRLLRQMGIISAKRNGKSMIYSISDKHIEEIFNLVFNYAEARNT